MDKSKKVAIIIGTKAELIKCMPIMLDLQKRKIPYWFIHTGQHPLQKACEEFGIKKPDIILSKEPEMETKFWSKVNKFSLFWFISMIFKVRENVRKINPSYIIYHGDTMSTSAASIGSSSMLNLKKGWKNVHLEAGLRSGSLFEPFPEEISRKISDYFSDILLAVSDGTQKILKKEYPNKRVIKSGNTVVDSSLMIYEKSKKNRKQFKKEYALINVHRHENLRDKERLSDISQIIGSIKIDAIWPLHENTKFYLEKYGLFNAIKNKKNLKITPLVNYQEFISLMANCKYLVTDGGSIQEESLVFKKPCIILRKATERQEGLATGINFLTKLNKEYSKETIERLEKGDLRVSKFENPYGKKGLSKKIVDILIK